MRIISFAAIRNYAKKHADADVPLRDWYKKTEKADWSCLIQSKHSIVLTMQVMIDLSLTSKAMITGWLL
jgi:mRNA-degrading endonuclease HigB of HigAB toxin-antitoxin module